MSMEAKKPTYREKEKRYMIWTETPDGKRGKAAYGKTPELCLARKLELETEYRDAQAVRQAIQEHEFQPGSLAHFVYDTWQPHIYAPERVRLSTKQKYDGQVKLHLLPAPMPDGRTLGEWQISDIGYEQFTALKKGIRRYKRIPKSNPPRYLRTDKPLSNAETREVLLRGREILNLHNLLAEARGERTRRDWELVELPRKPDKKERAPLPEGFARRLIAEALRSGVPWMAGHLFFAQFLGGREGESCGLWRQDFDRSKAVLKLRRQRRYMGKGLGFQDVDLKSKKSKRDLHMPTEFVVWLERFASPNSAKYMFVNNAGGPCNPRKLCDATPKLCKAAGLPVVGFHDLRSYAATNLWEEGVDWFTIQSILGHVDPRMTEKYVNERGGPQRAAFSRLSKQLDGLDELVDAGRPASA